MFSGIKTALLQIGRISVGSSRGIARIPHWEYHIRFDQYVGRKRPAQDILDRFKRLNNGEPFPNSFIYRLVFRNVD